MDKLNQILNNKRKLILLFSGLGFLALASYPRNKKKNEKKIKSNDELDSLINARIPGMNNQNAFNMRDKNFNEKFFEK